MQIINDSAALASALDIPIDPAVRPLLLSRSGQLMADTDNEYDLGDLVRFILVDPGDTAEQIEKAAGYPVVASPAFEWVIDHAGYFEATVILSDDGFGLILLVPDSDGVDPTLLSLLREQAESLQSNP